MLSLGRVEFIENPTLYLISWEAHLSLSVSLARLFVAAVLRNETGRNGWRETLRTKTQSTIEGRHIGYSSLEFVCFKMLREEGAYLGIVLILRIGKHDVRTDISNFGATFIDDR